MGLFKRVHRVVSGSLDEWLKQFENPEAELNRLMGELQKEKKAAHQQLLQCIADEKRLEIRLQEHQALERQWQERARLAVVRDEDELARQALEQRRTQEGIIEHLTRQWEEHHAMLEELEAGVKRLDSRYQEAQITRVRLMDEFRLAEAQKKAGATLARLSDTSGLDAFARVEDRIRDSRAMGMATTELATVSTEERFRQLEAAGSVDAELLQLKLAAGKSVPGLPSGRSPASPPALPE